ncbi:hypothetical protein GCM10009716_49400 [Streptomyces sodiiphilus]|uniref:DUF4913 domain-containing protein n=1 Tax=Streptomyces sodiiphilus TaxID=226217 RepID=A0ABP5BAY3_9ACTN
MTDHPKFPDLWDDPADAWSSRSPERAEFSQRRWVWEAMEPAERIQRLNGLAAWVKWLRNRHELHNEIPACWYRHPPVVERLTALYAGYVRTYMAPSPGRDHAEIEWIHALSSLLPQLKRPGCSGGHHDPPHRKRDQAAAGEDFEEFLQAQWPTTAPVTHPAEAEVAHLDPPL